MRRGTARLAAIAMLVAACGDTTLPRASPPPTTTLAPTEDDDTGDDTGDEAPADDEASADDEANQLGIEVGTEWLDVTLNLAGVESYCGNLAFVSSHPTEDLVFASVSGQGLFSFDWDSQRWNPFGRGSDSAAIDHRASGVVYDPQDPDRFWESGYFSLGPPPDASAASVNRTDDGGETFTALPTGERADGVSVDVSDPFRRTLLIGIRGEERVVASFDGGATWSDASGNLPGDLGEASFPHVLDRDTFLVGTHKGDRGLAAEPGIFRTTDAGETWERVFDRGVSGPPLETEDGVLYWMQDVGGVTASYDQGASWIIVSDVGPGNGRLDARRNKLVETDSGSWLALGARSVVVSRDRGATWRQIGPRLPFEPSGFTYSEANEALFVWKNYCDLATEVNPIVPESVMTLDLDLDP